MRCNHLFMFAQALALLLRGNGTQSFLDGKAISTACEDMLPMLEHGLTARAQLHIPCSPKCQSTQKQRRAQSLALTALHVLDLSLFSAAVMLTSAGLRPAALRLLCEVYRLACLPQSSGQHYRDSPLDSPDAGKRVLPALHHTQAICIWVL